MGNVNELTKLNFRETIESKDVPVLVDFWAPWCGPCRMIAPELEAVAKDLGSKVKIGKVNVDNEPELAEQYGVQSIPNMIVFKNGKPIRQLIGFMSRNELIKALSAA
jgi:thioredoxin 1